MKKLIYLLILCLSCTMHKAFAYELVTQPAQGSIFRPGGHIKIQWKHKESVRKYRLKIFTPDLSTVTVVDDWVEVHNKDFTCSPCNSCVPPPGMI